MCSPFVRREANRFNWIIKGKLIDPSWSDDSVEKTYHSYFKRLWGNNEIYLHEEGFDAAYTEREAQAYLDDINTVAVLGGHYD
jgi:hypothetical protein|tara:strand:+ start:815 stop:1063 length:249 start_codon:yes stop_codon:yes gene_type:complete